MSNTNSKQARLTASLLASLILGCSFTANSQDVVIPIFANIIKDKPGNGLAIRSDSFIYQASYLSSTFEDVIFNFDIVRTNGAITLYQMTISELTHSCNNQEIYPTSYIDGSLINKSDILTGFDFNQSSPQGDYRQHTVRIAFPTITQEAYEQSCNGVLGISVAEQI